MSLEVLPSQWSTPARVRVVDGMLARLGRGTARLRLRVGEVLDRLAKSGGFGELGFSSMGACVEERCERGVRWGRKSQAVARRLLHKDGRGLPLVRRAVLEGRIGWSMAELLSSHATADDEAELVAAAQRCSVAKMKARLKGGDASDDTSESEDDDCVMRIGVGFDEASIAAVTRMLIEGLEGGFVSDARFLEAVLAEAESALLDLERSAGVVAGGEGDDDDARRRRHEAIERERRARAIERAEAGLAVAAIPGVFDDEIDAPLGSTVLELDAELRRCCSVLARRDLEIGRLYRFMFAHKGWYELGHVDEEHYASERVGLSRKSLQQRRVLARRVEELPALGAALCSAALGYEAARLVGLVAEPATVDAWIERAKNRTFQHLREEVNAVELRRRLGEAGPFPPPDDGALEEVAALERAALSGELFNEVLAAKPPGRQISVRAGWGQVLRLRVSRELMEHFHRLRARFERVAPREASFIGFACLAVWDAWLPAVRGTVDRWVHIHRRDRFRCCSPVCKRRDVTLHHLVFRSHGGGDDPQNNTSVCWWCHLEGIHGGRLRASPPASKIRWEIGREPIMIVDGRDRRLLDKAS